MSGGAYNYFYQHLEDVAQAIDDFDSDAHPIDHDRGLRGAFTEHLRLVADALRAIEWADSGDTVPGSELAAIRRVFAR